MADANMNKYKNFVKQPAKAIVPTQWKDFIQAKGPLIYNTSNIEAKG